MSTDTDALRERYPGWHMWQSDRGNWWATRRRTRDLPSTVNLTVGEATSPDELVNLIEADDAELALHGRLCGGDPAGSRIESE